MRLLMISNQHGPEGYAGFQDAFRNMTHSGELSSFRYVTPLVTGWERGRDAALEQLMAEAERKPDVVVVATPAAYGHDQRWVDEFLRICGRPIVLYYEGDAWDRWAKRIKRSMAAWLRSADVIFTAVREPHASLFRRAGATDVRLLPHTYCQVTFTDDESDPRAEDAPSLDAVVIGNRLARWGRVSRIPGAVQRARLVRKLQHRHDISLALYGAGWSGRGARGPVAYADQTRVIREARLSLNWDHYPQYESYVSDRLPISMLAGRPHVTTDHPGLEWLPRDGVGLFLEPTVGAVFARSTALMELPLEDLLAMGTRARTWVRGRLSHEQAARYVLAAVDARHLRGLPEPWPALAARWPG